jgi:viologen exporter family transport system ATP-binding protein
MNQIIVEELTKTFYVARRAPGLWGSVKGLVKRQYEDRRALDHISFSIAAGELVGYIGPNGAGKSTTVKILSGILVPDSGRVTALGKVPWRQRVEYVRRIGVVFGQRTQLWWDLPVLESFDLLRDIYSVPPERYKTNRDALIQKLDLGSFLHVTVRQLSLGQRMRCEIAASLLHDPEVLFLDEPTIGLDAMSKLVVREFIANLNTERGVTVILTTHDMDDIEALCRRVMVIGDGKILSDGTLNELRASVTTERWLTVDLAEDAPILAVSDTDARLIRQEGRRVWLAFDPQKVAAAELIARIVRKCPVHDLFVENPPIEAIIARLYSQQNLR